jgi:SAM-dependent methyltransferase
MTHSAEYLANLYQGLGELQNDFRNFNLLRLIAGCVRGSRVLDIGCGSGGLLSLLHEQGHSVCGLEPNNELVGLADKLHPELDIVQGTGADLDRVSGSFDSITLIDVLEHIEDDRGQLQRIWNRLVPGGQLIVFVPAFPVLYGERDRNNGHFRRYTRRELTGKLREIGFEPRQQRFWNALGFLPYFISERLLHRELNTELRTNRPKNWFQKLTIRLLHAWFRLVENRISFGFGLSFLCVAEKPRSAVEPVTRSVSEFLPAEQRRAA